MSLLIVNFWKVRLRIAVIKQKVQSSTTSLFLQQWDILQPEFYHPFGIGGNLVTLSGTQLFHQ